MKIKIKVKKTDLKNIKDLIKNQKAQADGASTIYMLLIVAIIAVVLIAVIKPMFMNSMKTQVNLSKLPSKTQVSTNQT
jgi:Flp pilus assembly pilin Flp